MLKETIEYKDFNDITRTEDFYFNLSESEVVEMVAMSEEDLSEKLKKIVAAQDGAEIMKTFKDLLLRSYGEKSADGKRFIKGDNFELAKAFTETEAYNKIFMRLVTDPDYAARFVNGVIPKTVMTTSKS